MVFAIAILPNGRLCSGNSDRETLKIEPRPHNQLLRRVAQTVKSLLRLEDAALNLISPRAPPPGKKTKKKKSRPCCSEVPIGVNRRWLLAPTRPVLSWIGVERSLLAARKSQRPGSCRKSCRRSRVSARYLSSRTSAAAGGHQCAESATACRNADDFLADGVGIGPSIERPPHLRSSSASLLSKDELLPICRVPWATVHRTDKLIQRR